MRRPFIAGNWKMNLNRAEAIELATAIAKAASDQLPAELAVCPPHVYLDAVGRALEGATVALGAQNIYHEPSGAFTGEVSATMVRDLGCEYVILGHSERRNILGESSGAVHKKVLAALHAGLRPIVCVGELLDDRQAGRTLDVIREQFEGSLGGLSGDQVAQLVIAYEPVWAIGTGQVATPEQAEQVHADLRTMLQKRYNQSIAETVRIQYGGSVKPDNAAELLSQPNIDGALVGGASLNAEGFMAIAAAAA